MDKEKAATSTPAVPEAVEDDERRKQGEEVVNGNDTDAESVPAESLDDKSTQETKSPLLSAKSTSDGELDDVSLGAGTYT